MALVAGTVAMENGSMAKAIYDSLNSAFGSTTGAQDTYRKTTCAAIASAVVTYIATNADVRIKTTDAALQRAALLVDTTGPAADRILAGAIE